MNAILQLNSFEEKKHRGMKYLSTNALFTKKREQQQNNCVTKKWRHFNFLPQMRTMIRETVSKKNCEFCKTEMTLGGTLHFSTPGGAPRFVCYLHKANTL